LKSVMYVTWGSEGVYKKNMSWWCKVRGGKKWYLLAYEISKMLLQRVAKCA